MFEYIVSYPSSDGFIANLYFVAQYGGLCVDGIVTLMLFLDIDKLGKTNDVLTILTSDVVDLLYSSI
jgi:hypothetical protein